MNDASKSENKLFSLSEIDEKMAKINDILKSLYLKLEKVDEQRKQQFLLKMSFWNVFFPKKIEESEKDFTQIYGTIKTLIAILNRKKRELENMKNSGLFTGNQVVKDVQIDFLGNAIARELSELNNAIKLIDSKIIEIKNEMVLVDVKGLERQTFKESFIKFFSDVEFRETRKFDKKYKAHLKNLLVRFPLIKKDLMERKDYIISCKAKLADVAAV